MAREQHEETLLVPEADGFDLLCLWFVEEVQELADLTVVFVDHYLLGLTWREVLPLDEEDSIGEVNSLEEAATRAVEHVE